MIKAIDYESLIKGFRSELITQSELTNERVLDTLSVRGPELSEIINSTSSRSFELCDTFIIFELIESSDNDTNVIVPDESNIDSIVQFDFNLKIYGGACHNLAQKISARFKDSAVTYKLRDSNGIFINGITKPAAVNEFINNTMWPRCDMTIKLWVRFTIDKLSNSEYADNLVTPVNIDAQETV